MSKSPVLSNLSMGASLVTGGIGGVVSALISPLTGAIDANVAGDLYSFQLNSFYRNPQIQPAPAQVLDLYNRGLIDETLCRTVLRNQGVNWGAMDNSARLRNNTRAWEGVRKGMLGVPSVEFYMSAWGRGFYDGRARDVFNLIKRAGGDATVWSHYVDFFYSAIPESAALVCWNHGTLTDRQLDETLKRNGYGHPWQRAALKDLAKYVPGPTDLIHFAVKEAFSVDIANRQHLYDEFPDALTPWLRKQGMAYDVGFNITADGQPRAATLGDLYWAAHWQPISAGQAYEMLHRIRPDRVDRMRAQGFDVQAFTIDNVRDWLRINDYPPAIRDYLAAVSYTPMRLVDIRGLLTLGHIARNWTNAADIFGAAMQRQLTRYSRQWAIAQFRDRGVHPDDAAAQADMALAQQYRRDFADQDRWEKANDRAAVAAVRKSYRAGAIAREEAQRAMIGRGVPATTADSFLNLEDAENNLQDIAEVTRAVKQEFFLGGVNAERAQRSLVAAGMTAAAAAVRVDRWGLQLNLRHRGLSTEKVQDFLARGMLTVEDARDRLHNLGWSNPDIALLAVEAGRKNLELQARALSTADSQRRRAAADLDKVQREATALVKQVGDSIRKLTPLATMQRWLRDGTITHAQFIQRLEAMGYPAPFAEAYALDAVRVHRRQLYQAPPPGTTASGSVNLPAPPPAPPAAVPQPHPPEQSPHEQPAAAAVQRPDTAVTRPATAVNPQG